MLSDLLAKLERAKATVEAVRALAADLPPDVLTDFRDELAAALSGEAPGFDLPEAAGGKTDAPPAGARGRGRPEGASAGRREAIVRLLAAEGPLTRTAIARWMGVAPSLANRAIQNPPGPDWFRTVVIGRVGSPLTLTPAGWDEYHRLTGEAPAPAT
jgi:hypothetical protein